MEKRYASGSRVVYNRESYIVVNYEGSDLIILKRVGSNTPITVRASEVHSLLEEGKDTKVDRVCTKLNG